MELNFERRGVKFFFRNPELDRYGRLVMEYKIEGYKESKKNDGYFFNAEFAPELNGIRFSSCKIKGKKANGVELPEQELAKVKDLHKKLKAQKEAIIDKFVDELLDGTRNIHFSIVGCDFPYYQPWVRNLPNDLEGQKQEIMEQAIKRIMGKDELVVNSCEYLRRKLKKPVSTIERLGDVLNPQYDAKTQEYHGYKKEVVTDFEVNLQDLLQPYLEKKKEKKKELEKREQETQRERKKMEVEVLEKGTVPHDGGKDPYAKVLITDTATKESAQFICRNIFDVGYVVNPDYSLADGQDEGGLMHKDQWMSFEAGVGWTPLRKATDFEKKAVDYLHRFPPIDKEIRM